MLLSRFRVGTGLAWAVACLGWLSWWLWVSSVVGISFKPWVEAIQTFGSLWRDRVASRPGLRLQMEQPQSQPLREEGTKTVLGLG